MHATGLNTVMMNVFFWVPTQDNGLARLLETQGSSWQSGWQRANCCTGDAWVNSGHPQLPPVGQ